MQFQVGIQQLSQFHNARHPLGDQRVPSGRCPWGNGRLPGNMHNAMIEMSEGEIDRRKPKRAKALTETTEAVFENRTVAGILISTT